MPSARQGWGAVFALTLCVATLIASEFMPVSLLTPIAADLHLSEGGAGQAISVSGIFAVVTSLLIASATHGIDRRHLLLGLTLLMIVSGLIVAFAPSFAVLMIGRALVGVVIGGFWSMSASTVMRLVREDEVPRALALLNGGNALATTIAAPLGSFLGQYIGWRGAFFSVVPLAVVTLVWLLATLPSMPSDREAGASNILKVLQRPRVPLGIAAVSLLFMGQFALFTYLRPFLETVTQVSVSTLSLILLVMGGAGLLGTSLIGLLLRAWLDSLLIAAPIVLAVLAVALVATGTSPLATAALLAGWGLVGTAAPVAWWTWLSKVLPDDAETGGGLMVGAVQLAITAGAALGGLLYDFGGYQAAFSAGALILCGSALVAYVGQRIAAGASSRRLGVDAETLRA
ncbi:MFS transporter [Sphingomonas deserti]|uniref:MFS transporter n=2 Tax=Allosphingosinicella deserti TaxID=2116704 RepID=A0A2P7QMD1_9SPHN|nr:MFS transporter [Sphingomonas deserti]